MQMVVVLAGIVEERRILAERAFDDLFEGLALEFGAFQQVVAVGHVGLMMLVVMIFQCFLGHMGLQRIIGVRKGGKREGHGVMSENDGRRGLTGTLIEGSIGLKHLNLGNGGGGWPKVFRRRMTKGCAREKME